MKFSCTLAGIGGTKVPPIGKWLASALPAVPAIARCMPLIFTVEPMIGR
jgi:hypothetical protein